MNSEQPMAKEEGLNSVKEENMSNIKIENTEDWLLVSEQGQESFTARILLEGQGDSLNREEGGRETSMNGVKKEENSLDIVEEHLEDSKVNPTIAEDPSRLENTQHERCSSNESPFTERSFQRSNLPRSLNSSSPRSRKSYVKKQHENSASLADLSFAEYLQAKRALLQSTKEAENSTDRIDRLQGIEMFLFSLLPELEELDNSQMKRFKREVLKVIDDITGSGS